MVSYVLTYDLGTSLGNHEQLTAFVRANRYVTQWAQPFIGCFLLKSDAGLTMLNESFAAFFTCKTLYMLARIDAQQTSGLLNPVIWNWLNQPENALSGLLGQYLLNKGGIAPRADE